ncbi:hypothetical protein K438DRAFT_247688 [Mycena galopus ATCC 62051]|nr:hypothetical protein K438DRAFT_247688 [Mycena galopus ATCC 62051]
MKKEPRAERSLSFSKQLGTFSFSASFFCLILRSQVLLTPIAQLSLSTGETPNQLNAGSQLTVIPVSDVEVTLPSTPTSRSRTQASTSATQRLIAQPSTAQPSTATPGGSSRTALGASAASNTGFPRASSSISSFPQSLSSSVPASPSSASSTLSFTLSPGSTQSAPSFSESAVPRADHAKSGPPRGTIIAVAVVIPVVVLVAVLFCIIRTQRTSTQHRIDRFTEVWSRRRTTIGAATISSFGTPATAEEGLNAESDWVATGQPVSAPETRRDDAATSSMSAAIQQQKLQFMVAELTARNAVLEQQASALSSRPYSLGMTENSELPPEYATVE